MVPEVQPVHAVAHFVVPGEHEDINSEQLP